MTLTNEQLTKLVEELQTELATLTQEVKQYRQDIIELEQQLSQSITTQRLVVLDDAQIVNHNVDQTFSTFEQRLSNHDAMLSNHDTRIIAAQDTANSAVNAANTAQSAAGNAASAAGAAQSTANSAVSAASNAQNAANNAATTASNAQNTANSLTPRVVTLEGKTQKISYSAGATRIDLGKRYIAFFDQGAVEIYDDAAAKKGGGRLWGAP